MQQNIYIKCPLCGEDNTETIYTKGNLSKGLINVICKNCSLVYINPRPSEEEYLEFHKEEFLRDSHGLKDVSQFAEKQESNLRLKGKVYDFLEEYLKEGDNVLDIGCGFGTLLHIIQEKKHCNIWGIELSQLDVEAGKKYYNLNLLNINFDDFASQPENKNKFDFIAMHHTFEHFPDPLEKLEFIKSILKDSGKVYIGVPNILNVKKRPDVFFQIGHPFSYSLYTIGKVLEKSGFKIIKFSNRAAFPGGMEMIISSSPAEKGIVFKKDDYRKVVEYVKEIENKFSLFRRLRDRLFFWLPARLRLKLSRAINRLLKKI
ncbi:MAG: hypothetical protein COU51_04065 [Parcubacteria group bacterium CG10_big_fil_rev_8_21_14_0_10_36_14]|nr:MAG: hypothetical protein COU51_04065 [Parcubacteria group bacterium CG10_big_fil_rev_8_21_14_0_10_36_14]